MTLTTVEPLTQSHQDALETIIRAGDTSTSTLADYIAETASSTGINPQLAVAIARAESGLVWNAKNPLSSASGAWQFLTSTWNKYCLGEYKLATSTNQKNDPIIQTQCALKMLKEKGGWKNWSESLLTWLPDSIQSSGFRE